MKIQAHRGYSGKYPENTMIAFEKAVEAKCDGIELDVHLTKDKQLVVIHDESVTRTTGAEGYVRDYTLKEIKKLDASKILEGPWGRQEIPAFEEYCEFAAANHVKTNIEIKTNLYYYEEIEEKVIEALKRHHLEGDVIFSSFNHLSLRRIKELAPDIPCGALVGKNGMGNAGYLCRRFGFELYHPEFNTLKQKDIDICKANGVELNVWTVDTEEEFTQLYKWGCRGAITNQPEACRGWLQKLEAEKQA